MILYHKTWNMDLEINMILQSGNLRKASTSDITQLVPLKGNCPNLSQEFISSNWEKYTSSLLNRVESSNDGLKDDTESWNIRLWWRCLDNNAEFSSSSWTVESILRTDMRKSKHLLSWDEQGSFCTCAKSYRNRASQLTAQYIKGNPYSNTSISRKVTLLTKHLTIPGGPGIPIRCVTLGSWHVCHLGQEKFFVI